MLSVTVLPHPLRGTLTTALHLLEVDRACEGYRLCLGHRIGQGSRQMQVLDGGALLSHSDGLDGRSEQPPEESLLLEPSLKAPCWQDICCKKLGQTDTVVQICNPGGRRTPSSRLLGLRDENLS